MDQIYGKSDNSNTSLPFGLPTHLPNQLPNHLPKNVSSIPSTIPIGEREDDLKQEQQRDSIHADDDLKKQNAEPETKANKQPVPVFGTDIVLTTEQDIDEWIKQRKLNWMKKISNNRVLEEQQPTASKAQTTGNRQNNRKRRNSNNAQPPQQQRKQQNRHRKPQNSNNSVKLNSLIIQRELQQENIQILDVIKEIFEQDLIKS